MRKISKTRTVKFDPPSCEEPLESKALQMCNFQTETQREKASDCIELSTKNTNDYNSAYSLLVSGVGEGQKTACKHGISPAERSILDIATHWLAKHHNQLVHITVEQHEGSEREARDLISRFKSDVVRLQRYFGLPAYWAEVLEGKRQVHSHTIACIPIAYAKRLYSHAYGQKLKIVKIYDIKKLRNYLLKEATPQAVYGTGIRRNRGSHKLGLGGGDRVRLSKALRGKLLQEGHLQPSRRTYASRSLATNSTRIRKTAT